MNTQPHASHTDSNTLMLGRYAERAYLEYAMSVVKGRALPEVSDGQKPCSGAFCLPCAIWV